MAKTPGIAQSLVHYQRKTNASKVSAKPRYRNYSSQAYAKVFDRRLRAEKEENEGASHGYETAVQELKKQKCKAPGAACKQKD